MNATPAESPIARYIRTHRETTPPTANELAARNRRPRRNTIDGITQLELANRVGCTQTAVASWETGTRRPGAEYLFTLAEVFQVDYLELLDRIRYPDRYPNDDLEAAS